MNYEDKTLTCLDCGQAFTFSADEQAFHAEKGFTNEPKRCPSCRQARRGQRDGGYGQGPREMHSVVCAECGKDTTVPFKPRGDRPVYCTIASPSSGHPHAQAGKVDSMIMEGATTAPSLPSVGC